MDFTLQLLQLVVIGKGVAQQTLVVLDLCFLLFGPIELVLQVVAPTLLLRYLSVRFD